jgi:hypothetical protein
MCAHEIVLEDRPGVILIIENSAKWNTINNSYTEWNQCFKPKDEPKGLEDLCKHTINPVWEKLHRYFPTLKENEGFGEIICINLILLLNSLPVQLLNVDSGSSLVTPQVPSSKLSYVSTEGINCILCPSFPLLIKLSIVYIYQLVGISLLGRIHSLEEVGVMLKVIFYNLGTHWKDLQCIFLLTLSSCLEQTFIFCFL